MTDAVLIPEVKKGCGERPALGVAASEAVFTGNGGACRLTSKGQSTEWSQQALPSPQAQPSGRSCTSSMDWKRTRMCLTPPSSHRRGPWPPHPALVFTQQSPGSYPTVMRTNCCLEELLLFKQVAQMLFASAAVGPGKSRQHCPPQKLTFRFPCLSLGTFLSSLSWDSSDHQALFSLDK